MCIRDSHRAECLTHAIERPGEIRLDRRPPDLVVGFPEPVSYTHLDVYKRQALKVKRALRSIRWMPVRGITSAQVVL